MQICFDNRTNIKFNDELLEKLQEIIKVAANKEGYPDNIEVSISFVNNEEIHDINKKFRNIDKPTDVLSFPMFEFNGADIATKIRKQKKKTLLGDIIVSIDKAQEQAQEYGHSFDREVGFLVAHSMFHLMGYDHMTETEEKIMFQKQEQVLEEVRLSR